MYCQAFDCYILAVWRKIELFNTSFLKETNILSWRLIFQLVLRSDINNSLKKKKKRGYESSLAKIQFVSSDLAVIDCDFML